MATVPPREIMTMNDVSEPEKLRVLWQKGRNMYKTFFYELEEVRKRIGSDEEFASWCWTDLGIGIDTLIIMAGILPQTDAARIKRNLKPIQEAEKQRKRVQRAVRKAERT
jgi:hypothetical protein